MILKQTCEIIVSVVPKNKPINLTAHVRLSVLKLRTCFCPLNLLQECLCLQLKISFNTSTSTAGEQIWVEDDRTH